MTYLTDKEIYDIIDPYLHGGYKDGLHRLVGDVVDPKYRTPPKRDLLYRGVRCNMSQYRSAGKEDKVCVDGMPIGFSFRPSPTSVSTTLQHFSYEEQKRLFDLVRPAVFVAWNEQQASQEKIDHEK